MKYLQGILILMTSCIYNVHAEYILDESRNRSIPVEITYPINTAKCSIQSQCPVAFLSSGYGLSHLKYTFITNQLNKLGYLVVAIAHELPNDPTLSISGDLYETRSENWRRGATTLDFLQKSLRKRFNQYDFKSLMLIGHSNGGDISAWLGNENKAYVKSIITLDHRRVPLPKNPNIQILSIRASDFLADAGVLPTQTQTQQHELGSCVVTIPKAKHNDMADFGPTWLKTEIQSLIKSHLNKQPCFELKKLIQH